MKAPDRNYTIHIRPQTVRKAIAWTVLAITLIAFLSLMPAVQSVLTLVAFAIFLAFILDPVVSAMENRGVNRLLAAALVFVGLGSLVVLLFMVLAPVVSDEVSQLTKSMEDPNSGSLWDKLKENLGDSVPLLNNPTVDQEIRGKLDEIARRSFSVVAGVVPAVISFVMLAFMTFFFVVDARRMKKGVVSWVPNRYFEMSLSILYKINAQLGRYIRGQLLVALIVGTLSVCALKMLDVRYAFFIGAVAGFANMIPYFGPVVGAVPAIVIVFVDTGSVGAVATVAVAFASIQLFENVFVSPFIVSKSVSLHPLTIIVVILIGGQLMGIMGMLLAVPTASIVKVTGQELTWGIKNYRIF